MGVSWRTDSKPGNRPSTTAIESQPGGERWRDDRCVLRASRNTDGTAPVPPGAALSGAQLYFCSGWTGGGASRSGRDGRAFGSMNSSCGSVVTALVTCFSSSGRSGSSILMERAPTAIRSPSLRPGRREEVKEQRDDGIDREQLQALEPIAFAIAADLADNPD